MPRLFVSDMDGTLLGADGLVSAESAEIITRLSNRGAWFTVATARTPATVVPLLADTATLLPAIVMTGAALWSRSEERFIHAVTFEADIEADTVKTFLDFGINPFIYTLCDERNLNVFHCGNMSRREHNFYLDRRDLPLKHFIFDRPGAYSDPQPETLLLLGIGGSERVMPLADELRRRSTLSVSAYRDPLNTSVAYIEVFSAGVSKSEAVLRMADYLGADGITVYGDNLNDLSMMAVADDPVAVANALPEVKAAASRVIGPNTESSVARDFLRQSER